MKQAEANAPRSIGSVHAGDLINTSSNENEWVNWFKGMKDSAVRTNVMAAPGSHEYSGDMLITAWKAAFEYPHNNPSKWNVVTFLQPVFSASEGRDEPVLRAEWLSVFQRNDIDLVLMGHDHTYARGYVNTNTTETPGLTTDPVYVVSNSGAKH